MKPKFGAVAVAMLFLLGLTAGPAQAGCPAGTTDPNYCQPGPPIVTTTAATNITATSATLNGTVNPNGSPTTCHFEYGVRTGDTPNYEKRTPDQTFPGDYQTRNVSADITGLVPNTTYDFRLVCSNAFGTTAGERMTFKTKEPECPARPEATTKPATDVRGYSARLNGTVNPKGMRTGYYFQYGVTTNYEKRTPTQIVGSDSGPRDVFAFIEGLQPNQVYHFRLVAVYEDGCASAGADMTFKTSAEGRVRPSRVLLQANPKRDSKKPYSYKARGKVSFATDSGLTKAQACSGNVAIKIKRGNKILARKVTKLRKNCRYGRVRLTLTKQPQKIRGRGAKQGKLFIRARFLGNSYLFAKSSRSKRLIYGKRR